MDLYIVLGYLGSGKTTFLKLLLKHFEKKINAVIVNDFGEMDVDGKILSAYNVHAISDGSIFCSCRSDQFVQTMIDISKNKMDNVIVETSGLANPYTLIDVFDLIKSKSDQEIKLKGVICLVDCVNFEKMLAYVNMVKMQVAASDVILLNKSDLCNGTDILRIKDLISSINPNARIEVTINAKLKNFEIKKINKYLPQNILDISVQKCTILLNEIITKDMLDNLCSEMSSFSHRIKGVVRLDIGNGIYQYCNGTGTFIPHEEGNFLIVLTCSRVNLKAEIKNILSKYTFAEIKA